jgi:hypothetical protein
MWRQATNGRTLFPLRIKSNHNIRVFELVKHGKTAVFSPKSTANLSVKIIMQGRQLFLILMLVATIQTACKPALSERMKNNPDAYDMVDDYCAGKKRDDSCNMPANLFYSSGPGKCITVPKDDRYIAMICKSTGIATFDPGMSEATSEYCPPPGNPDHIALPHHEHPVCGLDEILEVDRFCKDKKLGDSCQIEFTYSGQEPQQVPQQVSGYCKPQNLRSLGPHGMSIFGKANFVCAVPVVPVLHNLHPAATLPATGK